MKLSCAVPSRPGRPGDAKVILEEDTEWQVQLYWLLIAKQFRSRQRYMFSLILPVMLMFAHSVDSIGLSEILILTKLVTLTLSTHTALCSGPMFANSADPDEPALGWCTAI